MKRGVSGRWRNGMSIAVKVIVSLLLLVILRGRIDFAETGRQIAAADLGGLAVAGVLFLCSNVLGAVQWRQLLLAYGLEIGFVRVLAYHLQGLFFGMFLPGNVGGDVSRVVDTTRRTGELGPSVAATILDRLVGFWSLTMMAAVSLALAPDRLPSTPILLPIIGFAVFNVGVASTLVSSRIRLRLSAWLERIPGVGPRVAGVLRTLGDAGKRPWLLGRVLALSMVVQVLRVVVHFAVAHAMGIDLPLRDFFVIVPVLAVLVSLPISFGGIGVRESAAVPLFGAVGVSPAAAVGMQVTAFLVSIVVNLPGWFIFLARQLRGTSNRSGALTSGPDVEKT